MATDESTSGELEGYFWRDGERIEVTKLEDRFTVRMKRGISGEKIAADYPTRHRHRLRQQNLDEFSVDAAERDAVMLQVRDGSEVEFASHVYAPVEDLQSKIYLTDQITLQFKEDTADETIEEVVLEHGLTLVKDVRGLSKTYVFQVGPQATENPITIANRLAKPKGSETKGVRHD